MENNMITYRLATEEDARGILAVYAEYIDTSITFEYVLPSLEEFTKRIRDIIEFYPYIVAECDGKIVGYAYSHRAFERIAYRWDAELSVYIARDFCGRGLGKAMYNRLIALSKLQNIHILYAKVTSPNEPSEALHRSMKFDEIAEFKNTGYKNGVWYGVLWYEMRLCEFEEDPTPPLSIHELDADRIRDVLDGK